MYTVSVLYSTPNTLPFLKLAPTARPTLLSSYQFMLYHCPRDAVTEEHRWSIDAENFSSNHVNSSPNSISSRNKLYTHQSMSKLPVRRGTELCWHQKTEPLSYTSSNLLRQHRDCEVKSHLTKQAASRPDLYQHEYSSIQSFHETTQSIPFPAVVRFHT